MTFIRCSLALTLSGILSLLCCGLPLHSALAAPAQVRLYDYHRHDLVDGGKPEPGRVQHVLTVTKPPLSQNGVRHVEYALTSASGRRFSAVHHREDGRDGTTGHIEVRDERSGKTVRWQVYADRFQQTCHDGTTIDVIGDDATHRLAFGHSSDQVFILDYDAPKTEAEREHMLTRAALAVERWCPIDEEHRAALAAAHHAGIVDLGASQKSFGSFFSSIGNSIKHTFTSAAQTVGNFMANVGKTVCNAGSTVRSAVCGVAGVGISMAGGKPVSMALRAGALLKTGITTKSVLSKEALTDLIMPTGAPCQSAFTKACGK